MTEKLKKTGLKGPAVARMTGMCHINPGLIPYQFRMISDAGELPDALLSLRVGQA